MITFVSLQSQFSLIRGTISLEWTLLESFSLFLKGIGSLLNLNNQSGDFVKQISTLDQITRMSSSWAEKKKEGNRSKIHPPLEEEKKNKRRWRGQYTEYRRYDPSEKEDPLTLTPSCTLVKRFFRQPMVAPERVGQASRISLSRVKTHDSVQVK